MTIDEEIQKDIDALPDGLTKRCFMALWEHVQALDKRTAARRKSSGRRFADVPGRRVMRRRKNDGKGHRRGQR